MNDFIEVGKRKKRIRIETCCQKKIPRIFNSSVVFSTEIISINERAGDQITNFVVSFKVNRVN